MSAMSSWDVVFKPAELAKFKDCGVHMLDSADDIMTAALHYLASIRTPRRRPISTRPSSC
jgi:spermidine/putrescine-binding protein